MASSLLLDLFRICSKGFCNLDQTCNSKILHRNQQELISETMLAGVAAGTSGSKPRRVPGVWRWQLRAPHASTPGFHLRRSHWVTFSYGQGDFSIEENSKKS